MLGPKPSGCTVFGMALTITSTSNTVLGATQRFVSSAPNARGAQPSFAVLEVPSPQIPVVVFPVVSVSTPIRLMSPDGPGVGDGVGAGVVGTGVGECVG